MFLITIVNVFKHIFFTIFLDKRRKMKSKKKAASKERNIQDTSDDSFIPETQHQSKKTKMKKQNGKYLLEFINNC